MTANSIEPLVSVVIPAFGRVEPLKYTLRSAAASVVNSGYPGEIIVVDDGSEPSLEEQLRGFDAGHAVRFVQQANQGSIVARMTGLGEARGKYVQFLDSDDLLHPDKIGAQVRVMEKAGVEVTYSDRAEVSLAPDYEVANFRHSRVFEETEDSLYLFITVQPSPHSPIYRRDYLERALAKTRISPHRIMDPSGDVWLFRTLAPTRASVCHVGGFYAGVGPHEEARFTQCWEKLGLASLLIDESLFRVLDKSPESDRIRRMVGETAFAAWRILPYDMNREFDQRLLEIWRHSRQAGSEKLGEARFRVLSRVIGSVNAGRLLRRLRAHSYAACKTLQHEAEFVDLLAKLPKPDSL
jgi:glycosyltransferase involved in cell wall biosynthesis